MTQVGIPAYRHCADWSATDSSARYNSLIERFDAAAAQLRKHRLKDPISQHYALGFYDGVEDALSAIEQALQD